MRPSNAKGNKKRDKLGDELGDKTEDKLGDKLGDKLQGRRHRRRLLPRCFSSKWWRASAAFEVRKVNSLVTATPISLWAVLLLCMIQLSRVFDTTAICNLKLLDEDNPVTNLAFLLMLWMFALAWDWVSEPSKSPRRAQKRSKQKKKWKLRKVPICVKVAHEARKAGKCRLRKIRMRHRLRVKKIRQLRLSYWLQGHPQRKKRRRQHVQLNTSLVLHLDPIQQQLRSRREQFATNSPDFWSGAALGSHTTKRKRWQRNQQDETHDLAHTLLKTRESWQSKGDNQQPRQSFYPNGVGQHDQKRRRAMPAQQPSNIHPGSAQSNQSNNLIGTLMHLLHTAQVGQQTDRQVADTLSKTLNQHIHDERPTSWNKRHAKKDGPHSNSTWQNSYPNTWTSRWNRTKWKSPKILTLVPNGWTVTPSVFAYTLALQEIRSGKDLTGNLVEVQNIPEAEQIATLYATHGCSHPLTLLYNGDTDNTKARDWKQSAEKPLVAKHNAHGKDRPRSSRKQPFVWQRRQITAVCIHQEIQFTKCFATWPVGSVVPPPASLAARGSNSNLARNNSQLDGSKCSSPKLTSFAHIVANMASF